MSTPRVRVILNPRAAAGAAIKKVGDIEAALQRYELSHQIVLTRSRGHASELARAAAADGVEVIAVVGGDGTLNEVIQAYVNAAGEPVAGPDVALIPCGTGGDFKRTLGMSGALDEAVARIRHGTRRAVDLGLALLTAHAGGDVVQGFMNVVGVGLGGQVDAIVNESHGAMKWLGGRASFFLGTLRAMSMYRNASVRVRVDGVVFYEGPVVNVAIANGRFFGAGMMIAPHADPSDGRFEVVALGDLTKAEVIGLTPKIYKGAHLAVEGVKVTSGSRVEVEAVHPWATVLIDVDGEQPGKLPLRATLAKGALMFRV